MFQTPRFQNGPFFFSFGSGSSPRRYGSSIANDPMEYSYDLLDSRSCRSPWMRTDSSHFPRTDGVATSGLRLRLSAPRDCGLHGRQALEDSLRLLPACVRRHIIFVTRHKLNARAGCISGTGPDAAAIHDRPLPPAVHLSITPHHQTPPLPWGPCMSPSSAWPAWIRYVWMCE